MDLSGSVRDIDSRGSTANRSLSSTQRAVIAILRLGSQGPDCRSFHSSHAPVLTVGSTIELLVGYSRGQYARH